MPNDQVLLSNYKLFYQAKKSMYSLVVGKFKWEIVAIMDKEAINCIAFNFLFFNFLLIYSKCERRQCPWIHLQNPCVSGKKGFWSKFPIPYFGGMAWFLLCGTKVQLLQNIFYKAHALAFYMRHIGLVSGHVYNEKPSIHFLLS